jgi:hypothetical protein
LTHCGPHLAGVYIIRVTCTYAPPTPVNCPYRLPTQSQVINAQFEMKRMDLFNILTNKDSAISFLKEKSLLQLDIFCNKCDAPLVWNGKDIIRCNSRIEGKKCHGETSIFKGSIFFRLNVDFRSVVFFLYEWCVDTPIERAAFEYSCSSATISRWYKKFRKIALLDKLFRQDYAIGGPGVVIEIDETCIVKNKNHQGRQLAHQKWFFGGVVRGDNTKCFIEAVEKRDQVTLLEVILRRILPGSKIVSDCWGAYNNLSQIFPDYNFTHLQVNHSQNFVDPLSGAHTQSIESLWSVVKRKLRRKGTNYGTVGDLKDKVEEDLFKRIYNDQSFERMIELISLLF